QLREKLQHNPAFVSYPIGLEDKLEGVIDLVDMKAVYFDGEGGSEMRHEEIPADMMDKAKELRHHLIEVAADFDDSLMEKFLMDEQPTREELMSAIRKGALCMGMTPVFCGSAYKNKGVQVLLDGVTSYLPAPFDIKNEALDQNNNEAKVELASDYSKPLVMLAFKLEDGRYGQLTYMRIYQGSIKKGDFINNVANGKKIKVPRLVRMHASEMHDIEEAGAGDIVAMFGVDCASGDTFTDGNVIYSMTSMFVPEPVIELAVAPKDKAGQVNFSKALNRFTKEDPTFRVSRDEESGETIIKGMGELHLDIYIERIKREYNTEVVVGRPKVAFREAISQKAEFNYTHKKQTGGSGQFGRVGGFIEPLPLDAVETYEFVDDIVGGVIPKEYIGPCNKGFQEAMTEGTLIGQKIVGVRVTLNDGATHAVDSSEQAFKTAALMAFREAYAKAKPIVLEPIMKLEVSVPEEFQGAVIGQINQRRGVILGTESDAGYVTVESEVPLSEMFGYSTDLRSATQGKGEFSMEFSKYSQIPKNIQDEMARDHATKRAEGR
ncbi:MAG: elongation factor G, partial [Candidatus Kapaibacteriota bacterium]